MWKWCTIEFTKLLMTMVVGTSVLLRPKGRMFARKRDGPINVNSRFLWFPGQSTATRMFGQSLCQNSQLRIKADSSCKLEVLDSIVLDVASDWCAKHKMKLYHPIWKRCFSKFKIPLSWRGSRTFLQKIHVVLAK